MNIFTRLRRRETIDGAAPNLTPAKRERPRRNASRDASAGPARKRAREDPQPDPDFDPEDVPVGPTVLEVIGSECRAGKYLEPLCRALRLDNMPEAAMESELNSARNGTSTKLIEQE